MWLKEKNNMMSKEEFVKAMMRNEEWKKNDRKRKERHEKRKTHSECMSFAYDRSVRTSGK